MRLISLCRANQPSVYPQDIGNAPLAANRALLKIAQMENSILRGDFSDEVCEFNNSMNDNNQKMFHLKDICQKLLMQSGSITHIIEPDANFNITFKIKSKRFHDDMELFMDILDKARITLAPCSGFGIQPDGMYYRLSYGINEQELIEGTGKLIDYLEDSL